MSDDSIKRTIEPMLADLAQKDPSPKVRAAAIQGLGKYKKATYRDFFINSANDSSYSVAGSALLALASIDSTSALNMAKQLASQHVKGELLIAVDNTLYTYADESEFDSLAIRFAKLPVSDNKFMLLQPFSNYLKKIKNTDNFRKGIDIIVSFRDTIPEEYGQQLNYYINSMILSSISSAKQKAGMTEQADYVKSKLAAKHKETITE